MGIQERRAHEQARVRSRIVSSALALAAEGGWEAVSMRRIAQHVGYGVASLYEYFPRKRAILAEIAREGFGKLTAAMMEVQGQTSEQRLLRFADCAWTFAFANGPLYQIMHSSAVFPLGIDEMPSEATDALALVRDALGEEVAHGTPQLLDDRAAMFWSAVSGAIMLAKFEGAPDGSPRSKRLMRQAVADLLLAWNSDLQPC
jgi:AcrR family transcriptional regulator